MFPIVTLLAASGVAAHSGKQSYVYVSILDRAVDGRVEYPIADLAAMIDREVSTDLAAVERFAEENVALIAAYTGDHLSIGDGERDWRLEFTKVDVIETGALPYVRIHFTVEEDFAETPRAFTVDYDGIVHANPERDALVIIEHDFGSATFGNEATPIAGLSTGMTTRDITLDDVSLSSSLRALVAKGLDAVRYRTDVIVFTVVLLALTVYVTTDRRTRETAWALPRLSRRAAGLFGVFVVSHSATMWLATIGPVPVTATTATSLAAVALGALGLSMVRARPRFERIGIALLAIGPGLALAEIALFFGIDRTRPVVSMLAFNVGVELALVVVVFLAAPTILLLHRTPLAPLALTGAAIVAVVLAASILLEVLADVSTPLTGLANSAVTWPRSIGLGVGLAAVAAGVHVLSDRTGRMVPLAPESERDRKTEGS